MRDILQPSLSDFGDSIGKRAIWHLDLAFRRLLGEGYPGAVMDSHFFCVIQPQQEHPFGRVAMFGANSELDDIRRALETLGDKNNSAMAFMARPADEAIHALVKEYGFLPSEAMPAMSVEIEALAPAELAEGFRFVRLREDAAEKAGWAKAFCAGYSMSEEVGAPFFPKGIDEAPEAGLQYFAVFREADGECVATSAMSLHDGIAGIYCVATIAEERGKGIGAYVTAAPLRLARALGYRVGVLQASKAGYPVYVRLGFSEHGKAYLYMRLAE